MPLPNAPFTTETRPYGKAAIEAAARLIVEGQPVAMPTETVYGLAADATNGEAVARIYAAKGRPSFNPLIVHVRDLAQAEEIGVFSDAARRLAEAYWPGPLTIVVPLRQGNPIASLATAGLATIALRCPAHPAIRDLLEASGRPLAAPSANASGSISPTDARHVVKTLDGRIPLVIDGGPSAHGLESTIVALSDGTIRLLRPGPVAFDQIAALAGLPKGETGSVIQSPGQLASHYAPRQPVRLNAADAQPGEWLIGFGEVRGDDSLSERGDLIEAASRLFGALHRADTSGRGRIAIAPVPQEGIGVAINDRLKRAAAAR